MRSWQVWFRLEKQKKPSACSSHMNRLNTFPTRTYKQKYSKRYEAYIGNKTTDSLIDSFIMLFTKGVGMVVSIDDVKELQKELKNDYIINQELSSLAGGLALRFGRLLALASTALITTKHIKFEKEHEPTTLIKFEKDDAPLCPKQRERRLSTERF